MDDGILFFVSFVEPRKEISAVIILEEDRLLLIPPGGDMVERPGILDSQLPGHWRSSGLASHKEGDA
ncbi:MAG: hypothetical protein ABSG73_04340 [Candidatus Aminicenantales bacterium]|jgi:hypothetical protein